MNFQDWWDVLILFTIPIGGGIPGGVLLAKTRGLVWPTMMFLYFVSDLLLAIVFEPLMHLIIHFAKRVEGLRKFSEAFKKVLKKTSTQYSHSTSPLALVMVAFGVDPMTGRSAAMAAGHGFVTGWAIAIAGDMLYFTVLMVSTLWLNNILGDGTWTMLIILALMLGVPALVKRHRERTQGIK